MKENDIEYNLKRGDLEIMAPVGSWESLMAALKAGADSVYFGIEGLNMRNQSANNFSISDLNKVAQLCKESNVKSYLTLNTIIYDNDLELMRSIIDAVKKAGITAIIASDVTAMTYAVSQDVEVHLSTQLNITNVEALKFYARFADVVVLARELELEQVYDIYNAIEEQQIKGRKGNLVRIEMFCHGALCMAVSGKCYLSLHEKNRSANRGSCNQICRRSYTVKDTSSDIELEIDNQYIMSPKDLKTIHFLNKMIDAGVRVFKIEGRARGAEYVRNVVECYNEAIEAYLDGTFTEQRIEEWNTRLARVFNRGFWDGYYLGQRLGEWTSSYGSSATRVKTYIGKCTNFFGKISVAEFVLESGELKVGDEILVIGNTTGAYESVVEEIRVDLKPVDVVGKGIPFSIKTAEVLHRNDKLYKMELQEQRRERGFMNQK
ncbi:MAG: peptidase U32 family protein [Porphyromonadaceae bacterium]|nr:peptidase U32 family protein [Porphyromonadaceae bacterium]